MKKLLLFLLVLIIVFVGFLVAKTPVELPTSRQERVSTANSWLKGVAVVYVLTQDKTVLDSMSLIEKNGVLAEPEENGFSPQRKLKNDDFLIVPLSRGDTFSRWRKMYKAPEFAAFWQVDGELGTNNFLIIKNGDLFSSVTKGILFLHEMEHVKIGMVEKKIAQNRDTYCRGEVKAHTLSSELFLKIGGEPYQKILNERANQISAYLLDTKGKLSPVDSYTDRLDRIFGKAISKQEKEARVTSFEIGSIFLAVDKNYPGKDKESEKAKLYCDMDPNANNSAGVIK